MEARGVKPGTTTRARKCVLFNVGETTTFDKLLEFAKANEAVEKGERVWVSNGRDYYILNRAYFEKTAFCRKPSDLPRVTILS